MCGNLTGYPPGLSLRAQAEALYALMESAGKDNLDFSGVMKLIRGDL